MDERSNRARRIQRIVSFGILVASGLLISILTEGRTSAQEPKGTLQSDFLIGEESRDVPSNKFLEVFDKRFIERIKEESDIQRYYFKSNAYTKKNSDINDTLESACSSSINEILRNIKLYAKIKRYTNPDAELVRRKDGKLELHSPFHEKAEENYRFRAVAGGISDGVFLNLYFYGAGKKMCTSGLAYDGDEFKSRVGRRISDNLRLGIKYEVDDEKNEVFSTVKYEF